MNYNFDVNDAANYGVDEAIMLANFKYWLRHNKANNKHVYDGDVWTYNSAKAMAELFPFWNERQVKRILNSLVSQNILKTGNYNKAGYDRTLWYAVTQPETLVINIYTKEEMHLQKSVNAFTQIGTPIPDKKTQIENTDIDLLYPNVNLEAWGEFEEHRKSLKPALTDLARKKLMNKIASLPSAKQQACIDLSIENGWKGLFPERQTNGEQRNGTRSNQAVSKQPDNSATRHHDRLKRAYAEAIAEEMDSEAVQQVPSDLQPQMVVSN